MELSWSHALIPVADMPVMLDFYTDVLGFKVADKSVKDGKDQIVFLSHLEEEHHQLAFFASDHALGTQAQGAHFAFRTKSLEDIKSLYRRLTDDEQVKRVSPVTHGNTWSIYFSDPEGNFLEIFCDTPWQINQPFSESWDPTNADDEIVRKTKSLISERKGFSANIRNNV